METEFWIEKSWGESVENATIEDAIISIEAIRLNAKDSIFWIGHINKEYVLQMHCSLDLVFIYGENQDKNIKIKLVSWDEGLHFIKMFLESEFLIIKDEIELKTFFNS